ncbi:hypothetical protein HK104_010007 [Borealophlyctis nickersoniae]|nr:hypothetical protein HK104_010007 [Borealophlyctis nickersoniae]
MVVNSPMRTAPMHTQSIVLNLARMKTTNLILFSATVASIALGVSWYSARQKRSRYPTPPPSPTVGDETAPIRASPRVRRRRSRRRRALRVDVEANNGVEERLSEETLVMGEVAVEGERLRGFEGGEGSELNRDEAGEGAETETAGGTSSIKPSQFPSTLRAPSTPSSSFSPTSSTHSPNDPPHTLDLPPPIPDATDTFSNLEGSVREYFGLPSQSPSPTWSGEWTPTVRSRASMESLKLDAKEGEVPMSVCGNVEKYTQHMDARVEECVERHAVGGMDAVDGKGRRDPLDIDDISASAERVSLAQIQARTTTLPKSLSLSDFVSVYDIQPQTPPAPHTYPYPIPFPSPPKATKLLSLLDPEEECDEDDEEDEVMSPDGPSPTESYPKIDAGVDVDELAGILEKLWAF